MESTTKWNIAFFVIGIIGIAVAILVPWYLSNKPTDPGTENNNLIYLAGNQRIAYEDLVNSSYSKRDGLVSEIKIKKPIPEDNVYNKDIDFELQFILKKNIDTRIRAYLVDSRGIIRYEYPKNSVTNFSSSDGLTNADKKICFNVKLVEDPSLIVDGQWSLNIILIDDKDQIVSEIVKPVNINSQPKKANLADMIILGTIIVTMIGYSFAYFLSRKSHKPNTKKDSEL